MTFELILVLIIIACILLICYISIYNNYQNNIIRINEAEAFIDTTLRKRFDLLNKSIEIIKSNSNDENILNVIEEIKTMKLSNFELDRKLYDAINEFDRYKEQISELSNNESFVKIELGLFESESEIVAARKYYNDIITDYNALVKKFPTNIVAFLNGYKEKSYFDGTEKNKKDIKL